MSDDANTTTKKTPAEVAELLGGLTPEEADQAVDTFMSGVMNSTEMQEMDRKFAERLQVIFDTHMESAVSSGNMKGFMKGIQQLRMGHEIKKRTLMEIKAGKSLTRNYLMRTAGLNSYDDFFSFM